MNEGRDNQHAKSGIRTCFRIFGKCIGCRHVHRLCHSLWQLAKLAALLLFFLWAFGLPGEWIAGKLNPHLNPYSISIQRITWSPIRGLIIHKPEVSEPTLGTVPVLTADSIFIRPDYRALTQKNWLIREVGIKSGRMLLPVSHTNSGTVIIDYMDLHGIEGKVLRTGNLSRMNIAATTDIGTRCRITGMFAHTPAPAGQQALPIIQQIHRTHTSFYKTPDWMIAVRERIDDMVFDHNAELVIDFFSGGRNKHETRGTLSYSSGAFSYRGLDYDHLIIELSLQHDVYEIQRAELAHQDRAFRLTGSYRRSNDVFEARTRNDLPMNSISVFFPESWQDRMTQAGMRFSGTMRSESWIGPCSLREVPRNWSAWISIDDAEANELLIDHAFASVKRSGDIFSIDDGSLRGGRGAGAGTITFSTRTDTREKITAGTIDANIDLRQVASFLPKGLKKFADDFEITDQPARFTGTLFIPHTNARASVVEGVASGNQATYRGVLMTSFETTVNAQGPILQLSPFNASSPTGTISGDIVMDLTNQIFGISLTVTADPGRVAPSVGSNLVKMLKPFVFSDNILLELDGVVHPLTMENTDLQVYLSGSRIGLTNIVADHIKANARLFGNKLTVSNALVTICGGVVTGRLEVTMSASATNFVFSGAATNLIMDRLVKTFAPDSTNTYEGLLSGSMVLAGPFPGGPGKRELEGSGEIQIRDGRLMRIPIFGGLSRLLSYIYPGMGFTEQNQLVGTFTVQDGAVRTQDVKLLGSVVSFAGRGRYGFNNMLAFDIQVQPLRGGIIASTLRLVTMPITKLLEFRVTGSVKDPKWEAKNIPLL